MQISITRALAELKLLDKRIAKEVSALAAVDVECLAKGKNLLGTQLSKEDFITKAKANYKSVTALIERRNQMKAAIVKSNATTTVTIGDKTFTVADAIERKTSIVYDEDLLANLRKQFEIIKRKVEENKVALDQKAQAIIEATYGKATRPTDDQYTTVTKQIYENGNFTIIDPLKIETLIETLDKDIDSFKSEVDLVLSESNSKTLIDVPDVA